MLSFDTHTYVKELQATGFTEAQAEVQAKALKNIIDNDLATKHDIELVRHDVELVRRDVKELETKMEVRFKEIELRLTTRLGGMLVVGIAVVATLVKLL